MRWTKRLLTWLCAAVLLLGVVLAVMSFASGRVVGPILKWAAEQKKESGFGGEIISQLLFTAAPLVLGFAVFLGWRYRRVPARYVRVARASPAELVETADSMFDGVAGRELVCEVLQSELRDPSTRRPHVIVGGLGEGKTALLVGLTQQLARRGAVPVPVHLRAVKEEIDFVALARERFLQLVRRDLRSIGEGDRVWRQLRKDDRIVVLADGLEEAFADEDEGRARHHRVRVAIRDAAERGIPVIVASRPHDALRALDAAVVHVEPLSENAALGHVCGAEQSLDELVADRLIETAQITEGPMYMRLARELHANGLLESIVTASRDDRVTLRCELVGGWLEALVTRGLASTREVALDEAERRGAVEHLSALACVALREDTQEISFDRYDPAHDDLPWPHATPTEARAHRQLVEHLEDELKARLERLSDEHRRVPWLEPPQPIVEFQAAASKGFRLNLVEPRTNGVRFPHSVMQAYLAARMLGVAIDTEGYLDRGLRDPGRELLLALVMFSRMRPTEPAAWSRQVRLVRDKLVRAIDTVREERRLDVIAAALDIDTELKLYPIRTPPADPVDREQGSGDRAPIADRWREVRGREHTTRDATRLLVARLTRRGEPGGEQSFFDQVPITDHWREIMARDDTTRDAKRLLIGRLARSSQKYRVSGRAGESAKAYRCLYEVCIQEQDYGLRLAAAQAIGGGGDVAWTALHEALRSPTKDWSCWQKIMTSTGDNGDGEYTPEECERRSTVAAWLLPMLLGSVADDTRRMEVDGLLHSFVRHSSEGDMPLAVEAALAQGFKHAANRRPHHSQESADSRALLQRRAGEMIYAAQFWYSRLTLLHALCLWQLSRLVYRGHQDTTAPQDPRAVVAGWLKRKNGREEHRFVLEAAELAYRALNTRKPWRYLWIDESGVITTIGSEGKRGEFHYHKTLWITPSAGWKVLEDRPRQLVADVLILLNLAERGEVADLREQRLRECNRDELPRCLVEERCAHLKPSQTVGMADLPNPGAACASRCQVRLCPYPPRGQQPYRVELSEAFCRRQQLDLRQRKLVRLTSWQEASRIELRRFWRQMEERARI